MRNALPVYAVVRIDRNQRDSGRAVDDFDITVKEILPTLEEAAREVERLNELNEDKGCRYFWQMTRYFPRGRGGVSPEDHIREERSLSSENEAANGIE